MINPPVLFLPIIEWSFRHQRPQQLARCFSRAGCRVYYPALGLKSEALPAHLVEGSIWRFALRGRADFDPYRDRMTREDVELAFASLVQALPGGSLEGAWIIVQLPTWRPLAERIREAFRGAIVFDCLDDYAAFSEHSDLRDEEHRLAATADLVVATAEALHARLAPLARRAVIIHNGCDPEHFAPIVARARADAAALAATSPTIGYFGGIHDWFDAELVAALADARPAWRFVLAGDTFHCDVAPLLGRANVALLGEVPYAELPRVVSSFDLGLIPFRINALTAATNPVKVYEMLAAGLPVVAADLPELRPLAPWVAIAHTVDEYLLAIERALAEPEGERRRRSRFAAEHAWSRRFWDLRRAMDDARPAGAALVHSVGLPGPLNDDGSVAERWPPTERLSAALESLARLGADRAALIEERDRAHVDLHSLIEQRDRVAAEARRLHAELERVEAERRTLEQETLERAARGRWGSLRRWLAR